MTTAAALCFLAFFIAAITDWNAVALGNQRLEFVVKPAATAFLLIAAALCETADPARRWWFVAALACSLAGDVFLMLPTRQFVAGLASFLVAHVLYIVGFAVDAPREWPIGWCLAIVIVLGTVAAVPLINGIRSGSERALLAPVLMYMTAISVMVAFAISTGLAWAIIGASFFFVSDYLIGWSKFVRGDEGRNSVQVAIMATYHVAQLGLVVSLLR